MRDLLVSSEVGRPGRMPTAKVGRTAAARKSRRARDRSLARRLLAAVALDGLPVAAGERHATSPVDRRGRVRGSRRGVDSALGRGGRSRCARRCPR